MPQQFQNRIIANVEVGQTQPNSRTLEISTSVVDRKNKVVQRAVSREHRSAPTKLPAPIPCKKLDGAYLAECVPIALVGLPNHPCALRAARIAPLTRVPRSYLTRAVDYSLDLPAEEIPCQVNQ